MNNKSFDTNDYGPYGLVLNIHNETNFNPYFRVAKWTGADMQMTLMSIMPGDDIGLEMHPDVEQFIRVEDGTGIVMMGKEKDNMEIRQMINDDFAVIVPRGIWHNIINNGNTPLKLYSIYAPAEHPHSTLHETKEIAIKEENNK